MYNQYHDSWSLEPWSSSEATISFAGKLMLTWGYICLHSSGFRPLYALYWIDTVDDWDRAWNPVPTGQHPHAPNALRKERLQQTCEAVHFLKGGTGNARGVDYDATDIFSWICDSLVLDIKKCSTCDTTLKSDFFVTLRILFALILCSSSDFKDHPIPLW